MRWGFLVLFVGCGIPALDGTDKECPCADGYVCDESRDRCVAIDAGGEDDAGGDDASFDVGPSDAARDGSEEDAGRDAGEDAGSDAMVNDAGPPDASAPDAPPIDVGVDAPAEPCPHDGLYCIDFEEPDPHYDDRGTDLFEIRSPGYMSPRMGYFRSTGDDAYVDLDFDDGLPSSFYARFWMRVDMGSFISPEPTLIAGFFQTSGDGVGFWIQNEVGTIAVGFLNMSGDGVFSSYTPVNVWSCIQLRVTPTTLSMWVNEGPELGNSVVVPSGMWDEVELGILDGDHLMGSGISIDELVIGASPIPCDL